MQRPHVRSHMLSAVPSGSRLCVPGCCAALWMQLKCKQCLRSALRPQEVSMATMAKRIVLVAGATGRQASWHCTDVGMCVCARALYAIAMLWVVNRLLRIFGSN